MDYGLWEGMLLALKPVTLGWAFIGCLLGTVVGVLPGLGPAATIALLLPLVIPLDATNAIVCICAICYGAMYGGSTTSILMNVPGEASSVVTCLDGYPMTKKGRAGEALAMSAIGSFIAGTGGVILLSFVALPLATFGLMFGAPEFFGLITFSLSAMVAFSGRNLRKGLATGIIGMLLSTVGLDPMTGKDRFTFGFTGLMRGIDVIPVLMGLFGITEVLSSGQKGVLQVYEGALGHMIPRGKELIKGLKASLRGSAIGLGLGLLPGMFPSVVSFICYDIERKISKYPELFGTGCIEGVASVEACNNAVVQAGIIPLLSFGIPTTPVYAMLLAVFTIHGFQPGPLLFIKNPDMVWTIIASMYIGNAILLILNLPLVGLWARFAKIPYRYLGPSIIGICVIGSYSVRNTLFDVWTMLIFGIIGFIMKSRDWPVPPMILGFILGPMFELYLRQSLQMSAGSTGIFFTRPICLAFLVLTVAVLILTQTIFRKTPKQYIDPDAL